MTHTLEFNHTIFIIKIPQENKLENTKVDGSTKIFLLYYITKFTHSYLSSNLHIVPCFESELYVILGVAGGMVEKHHLKFLIKALTELIYPFQPTDKPHINFPLSLSEQPLNLRFFYVYAKYIFYFMNAFMNFGGSIFSHFLFF